MVEHFSPASPEILSSLARLRRITQSLLAAVTVILVSAVGYRLFVEYGLAVDAGLRSARTVTQTVESNAARTLGETFKVLDGLADVYRLENARNQVDEQGLHSLMAEKMAAMPYVRAFFIVRPDGHVLASARVFPIDKSLDLFALAPIHPQNDKDTHFLGAVAPGVRDEKGTLIFPIGTRVKDDTGDVVALVIAILNPVYFTDFYKTVDVGGDGHIGLWTSAGQLVAKNANTPTLIGSLDPAIERYIANMDRRVKPGELTAYTSRAGGVAQIDAYARVEDLPLHVLVSNTDYLAGWRDTRNRFALAVTALVSAMLACAIIILRQVERSRANEEALRHAKAVAEEANEAKSRFLAHMSHEFRTPLNAIMGFADIIRSKVMGEHISPVYASYADHIHRSGEHLLNIVNDVLDMAKIESGMQSIQHTTVDVAGVVARSISFVEQMAQQYSLILRSDLPAHLPHISSDERFVRQVLINLLSNALKFSLPGNAVLVAASVNTAGGVDIAVSDKGPGIDPVILRRIGEPFLQGNPTLSRAGRGTGLGLSICKHYMELLGGELVIESTLSAGTTAIMRFPRALLVFGTAAA